MPLSSSEPRCLKFGQVYLTTTYPGVVKAWHYHKVQTDTIVAIRGMIKLVLYDPREDSPTRGEINEFFMGDYNPILLQIPVFFALYKVLMVAFELRGAPFLLWITDLSEPDTLFGHLPSAIPLIGGYAIGPLPILMGFTMLIQQKMTPTTLDPTQNKIMMAMSVFFTFIFLNFASGLVL